MRLLPRPKTLLLTVLLILAALLPRAEAEPVRIKAQQNGKYATFVGGYLAASATRAGAHVFDMIRLDGTRVAFRDPQTGRFLRAGVTQTSLLALGEAHIRGWETFEQATDGPVSTLRSVQNGKYLRAGIGAQTLFGATSDRVGAWEAFLIEPVGRTQQQAPQTAQAHVDFAGDWQVAEIYEGGARLSYNDRMLRQTRFTITPEGRFSGTAGCNQLGATITQRGVAVAISPVLSTRMLCNTPGDQLERHLAHVLDQAVHFSYGPRQLLFYDRAGQVLVEFRARGA